MTAVHIACRNSPPLDVIDVFLTIADETLQAQDSFGWLPIHYACACAASSDVVKVLAEKYPESKTTVDRRGRTPLHFALGQSNRNPGKLAEPAVIAILANTGAAGYADEQGMLPLHYACAYGATEEALFVLTEKHHDAIRTRDQDNRTPLHFALSNAERKTSPGAVRHLLELDPSLANTHGVGPLPLRTIADYSLAFRKSYSSNKVEAKENIQKCLEYLLNKNPEPTADFFTALQALPDWLSDKAVVLRSVQELLNLKITQRFPTLVLMADLYFLCMTIIAYSFNVIESIKRRFDDTVPNQLETAVLIPLYIGSAYFILREIIQIISLISLKSFHIYLHDPSNWVNIAFIVLVLYWTILMDTGGGKPEVFRVGTALSVVFLWLKMLGFLRNLFIDFAVFTGGVFYVFRRLIAFLIVLGIILVMFAQIFVTDYKGRNYCKDLVDPIEKPPNDVRCDADDDKPWCSIPVAFLSVYTMLLGEVDETAFEDSTFSTYFFCVFMFLCVILLANVLIAIVTDSYKVIQDQRAAIVFWSNRLNFVAEMDAIANGPWKEKLKRSFGMKSDIGRDTRANVSAEAKFWKSLMDLFTDDIEGDVMSFEFWIYTMMRVVSAVFIIPMWILLGFLSFGWFWPPQFREMIFTASVSIYSSESEREDELRKTQVELLQKEVRELSEDMTRELQVGRSQAVQMKLTVTDQRSQIVNEMKHIKRIMTMLFEQQSAFG